MAQILYRSQQIASGDCALAIKAIPKSDGRRQSAPLTSHYPFDF
jgi:hypothetical protein